MHSKCSETSRKPKKHNDHFWRGGAGGVCLSMIGTDPNFESAKIGLFPFYVYDENLRLQISAIEELDREL